MIGERIEKLLKHFVSKHFLMILGNFSSTLKNCLILFFIKPLEALKKIKILLKYFITSLDFYKNLFTNKYLTWVFANFFIKAFTFFFFVLLTSLMVALLN